MEESLLLDKILNYHLLLHTNKNNKNLIQKFNSIARHFDPQIEDWRIKYLKEKLYADKYLEPRKYGDGDDPCSITIHGIKAAELHLYYPEAKPKGIQIATGSPLNEDEKYEAAEELMLKLVECLPKNREFEVLEVSRKCDDLSQIEKGLASDTHLEITELLVENNFAYYSRGRHESMYHLKRSNKIILKTPNQEIKYQNVINRIFISHSSTDEKVVKKFVDIIIDNALGFEISNIFCTSIEGLGIESGKDFKEKIKSELLASNMVLQFISKDYKQSEVCLNEMGAAWVLSDRVIPFVIGGNYDIGFIHKYDQQLKIDLKSDLLKFISEQENYFPNKSQRHKIDRHINEFLDFLNFI